MALAAAYAAAQPAAPSAPSAALTADRVPGAGPGGVGLDTAPGPDAFDRYWVNCPSVLRTADGYRMWYSSYYDARSGPGGIGLATSDDGLNWRRANGGKPVLGVGPGDALDAGQVMGPCVLPHGAGYRMWYTGMDAEPSDARIRRYRIFLAESDDGVAWRRLNDGKPVLDLGPAGAFDSVQAATPCVLREGDGYRMWYAAWSPAHGHVVCTARSEDGVNWRREREGKPVAGLRPEAFGQAVTRVGDRYLMLHMALKAPAGLYAAVSDDGVRWTQLGGGAPVLDSPGGDAFDSLRLGHPDLHVDGDRVRIWYTGYRREPDGHQGMRMRIAAAELPLTGVTTAAIASKPDQVRKPNVLMICIDDMNDFIACMGSYRGVVHTPNMDRLAARGRLFTNAHCTATMCGPSRNSVMLGKYPWTTDLYRNGDRWIDAAEPAAIMSAHFMANGYHAAGAGKVFHQGPKHNSRDVWSEYHRFDLEYEWIPKGHPINGIDRKKHKMYPTMDWGPLEEPNRVMYDAETARYAVEFLGRRHEKPFFLTAGIILPHIPWYAPREFFDKHPLDGVVPPKVKENDLDDVPAAATRHVGLWRNDLPAIDKTDQRRQAIRAYLACISYVDHHVGQMLDALEKSPHADNTIVVLWSDHGWHLGEKDWWHKFSLWERSTRVPLIIAGPGVAKPGESTDRPASLVDLYPTLIELCGLTPRGGLDGVSLAPQLADPAAPRDRPALTTYMRGDHAARDERWRYIRYHDGSEELYDHQSDPDEWTNLADDPQHDAVKERLGRWVPKLDRVDTGGAPGPRIAPPRAAAPPPDLSAMQLTLADGFEPIGPVIVDDNEVARPAPAGFTSGTPVKLDDGRLMMLYADGGQLRAAISADGGHSWREDRSIQRNPDETVRIGRPTAVVDAKGVVHVFYFGFVRFTRDPATSQSDMWTVRSTNGGRSWTGRQKIWSGYTGMTEPAIAHSSGRLLVPLGYLVEPGRFAACVVRSDDGGRTWSHTDGIALPREADADARTRRPGLNGGALEPTIAELSDGRVLMLVRTLTGRFWRSVSADAGATWTALEPTDISCGGPGVVRQLGDGRLLLIANPADASATAKAGYPHGFARQYIAVSADDGATWSPPIDFVSHPTRVVHSVAAESLPGMLLLTVPGKGVLIQTALPQPAAPAAEKQTASRPNILFFYADDLGYGDLACYGSQVARTPQLDKLASQGTRFTQFYVSHCVCSPTRASAITGQYPSHHRIYAPISSFPANAKRHMPNYLAGDAPSMPAALRRAGYRTAMIGKWHLGGGSGDTFGRSPINDKSAPPVASYGFDHVRVSFGNGPAWKNAEPVPTTHDVYPYEDPGWLTHSSRAIADEAIAFITDHAKTHGEKPFYANVWFKDPHTPFKPTPEMLQPFAHLKEPARSHYAMIAYMDEQIGRVLAKLDELGLAESTLVLFSSDNGAVAGRGGSNGELRGHKWTLHEGGIRVPLIVRWPGRTPAGAVDEVTVANIVDFTPTFCRLAGAEMPDGYEPDGMDIGMAFTGRPFAPRPRPMFWHHPTERYRPDLAIRDGDLKLTMNADASDVALYDLSSDVGESKNLVADRTADAARLKAALTAWQDSLPKPYGKAP